MASRSPALLILAAASVAAIPSGQTVAPDAAARQFPGSDLPIAAEYHYTVTASIRPLLLFWISRDNVGSATLRWRAGGDGRRGFELLIGSDPDRAPRRVNQWGFIAEEVGPAGASLLGVMKESNDETLEAAEKRLAAEGGGQRFFYKAIRTNVVEGTGRTETTRLSLPRDPTYRDVESVLAQLPSLPPSPRQYAVSAGVRPGYLATLQDLIMESVGWDQRGQPRRESPVGRSVPYIFNGTVYDLALRSVGRVAAARYRGHAFSNLIDADFLITNRTSGYKTRFKLQYGRTGPLAGVPVHGSFRPNWWFEVEIILADEQG